MSHRNLACMWVNFRQAGADRLIMARGLHDRSPLRRVTEPVPGAQITVVRLQASLAVLHERIRSREASDPGWYLDAATHGAQVLEQADFEDQPTGGQREPSRDSGRPGSTAPGRMAELDCRSTVSRPRTSATCVADEESPANTL